MKTGKETKPSATSIGSSCSIGWGDLLTTRTANANYYAMNWWQRCCASCTSVWSMGYGLSIRVIRKRLSCAAANSALNLPIACFTEWSLGESLPHTTEYGRIGLGFPKRWVIDRGGQSVTYSRHNAKGSFLHAVFKLLETQGICDSHGVWKPKPGAAAFEELRYLLHFAKMIRLKAPEREAGSKNYVADHTAWSKAKAAIGRSGSPDVQAQVRDAASICGGARMAHRASLGEQTFCQRRIRIFIYRICRAKSCLHWCYLTTRW